MKLSNDLRWLLGATSLVVGVLSARFATAQVTCPVTCPSGEFLGSTGSGQGVWNQSAVPGLNSGDLVVGGNDSDGTPTVWADLGNSGDVCVVGNAFDSNSNWTCGAVDTTDDGSSATTQAGCANSSQIFGESISCQVNH